MLLGRFIVIITKESIKMAKITKKSINKLMDIYKLQNRDTVLKLTDSNNNVVIEVEIKTALTIPEKGAFVNRVVNACFDDNGDFMPEYLDPVFIITLLQMTTNIPVFESGLNEVDDSDNKHVVDIEKTYELCKAVNLVKNVNDVNYQTLVSELKQMVNDKLAYMREVRIRKKSNSLTIMKNVIDKFKSEIEEYPDSFTELIELFKNSISKIDEDVISFPITK